MVSEALRDRAIVAVKGLGGYRLACVAGDEQAVARLRSRVDDERSFAVMAADLEALEELADLGPVEAALLRGRDRPVVLARRRHDAPLAAGPACLGVMLPVSALDHLLLEDAGAPLAIAAGDPETADLVLTHDRPVHTAVGDSVLQVVGGRPQPLRRGRGAVPSALALPGDRHVLACGAELDSTFCLARAGRAWVSHHLGDLRSADALAAFQHSVRHFEHLFSVNPDLLAHDLHPDHLSTTYALAREGVEHVAVQHHHAHLAACLAEHGEPGPAVAAVFDGGGQGPDGTLWGGEILVGGLRDFERAGHLWPVPLPGGEQAAREPWRMACAWLKAAGDERPLPGIEPDRWRAAGRLAETGTPVTTSVGRLLAAVGALCDTEDAFEPTERGAYEFDTVAGVLDARPAILAARRDATRGVEAGRVVARFIHALADATADDCARLAADRGLELVVLTGDAFQDRHLLARAAARLARTGLRVLVATRLPPNDGGISFGQAAVAATRSG